MLNKSLNLQCSLLQNNPLQSKFLSDLNYKLKEISEQYFTRFLAFPKLLLLTCSFLNFKVSRQTKGPCAVMPCWLGHSTALWPEIKGNTCTGELTSGLEFSACHWLTVRKETFLLCSLLFIESSIRFQEWIHEIYKIDCKFQENPYKLSVGYSS